MIKLPVWITAHLYINNRTWVRTPSSCCFRYETAMKCSRRVKSRSWGWGLGKVECTQEVSASPTQNRCFRVVPLQITVCIHTYVHTPAKWGGNNCLQLGIFIFEHPRMAQRMGKISRLPPAACRQQGICTVRFAVFSHVSRAGGVCSIKLLMVFTSSPGPEQGGSAVVRSWVPPIPGEKHAVAA